MSKQKVLPNESIYKWAKATDELPTIEQVRLNSAVMIVRIKGFNATTMYDYKTGRFWTSDPKKLDSGGTITFKNEEIEWLKQIQEGQQLQSQQQSNLFQKKEVTLHSGEVSDFKIECDALIDADLDCLAYLVSKKIDYSRVVSVPRGGDRFANALRKYRNYKQPPKGERSIIILCDDVLSTGKSMEEKRQELVAVDGNPIDKIKGIVIFSRGKCPDWVTPIFSLQSQQQEIPFRNIFGIIHDWLNSDDVFVTDKKDGKVLPDAYVDCKKGSLLKRLTAALKSQLQSQQQDNLQKENDMYCEREILFENRIKYLESQLQSQQQSKESNAPVAYEINAIYFAEWVELNGYRIKGMDDTQRRNIYKQFKTNSLQSQQQEEETREAFLSGQSVMYNAMSQQEDKISDEDLQEIAENMAVKKYSKESNPDMNDSSRLSQRVGYYGGIIDGFKACLQKGSAQQISDEEKAEFIAKILSEYESGKIDIGKESDYHKFQKLHMEILVKIYNKFFLQKGSEEKIVPSISEVEGHKINDSEDWEEKLYKHLQQIYNSYAFEWADHQNKETADLLYDYQTRNIP